MTVADAGPESVITEDMRRRIGIPSEPWVVEVERGAIVRYADAIGDPNPVYRDRAYAQAHGEEDTIAPPGFLGWPVSPPQSVRLPSPFFRNVTGGMELVYERPICAGERLIATAKLVDLYEKQGRPGVGRMLFQDIETTYRDMDGRVAVVHRVTDITFEGGDEEEVS
jgi:acyl dehydratase